MKANSARRHHLTDSEFSDLLCGDRPSAEAEGHLAECDHCRHELELVGGSLGSFRELGTSWAQTQAPALVAIPSRWARRLVSVPSWGTGLAVTTAGGVLAFALGLPSGHAPSAQAALPPAAPATSDLAQDNRLMLSIDQELSYRAPAAGAISHADARRSLSHTTEAILD